MPSRSPAAAPSACIVSASPSSRHGSQHQSSQRVVSHPSRSSGAKQWRREPHSKPSRSGGLDYFGPVARTPGFPRALARTLHELMLARVDAAALASLPLGGADLARLLERFEDQFAAASATDRGALFEAAAEAAGAYREFPLLLLDVPLDSAVEFDFATKLIAAAPDVLVTIPFGDLATLDRFKILGLEPVVLEPGGTSDLTALKRYVFATRQPPERRALGDVRIFSAPGEGRECVEIARRILDEARSGVPFDEMAVFVRSTARLRRPARSCVRACRDSRLVRSRHGTPAPVGPGISGPSRMRRGAAVGGTVRGIPLPLAGAGGLACGRGRDPAARRRSVLRIHGHRIAAGRARSRCRGGSHDRTRVLTVRSVGTSDPRRPERRVPVRSRRHSSRAVEVGNAHRRIRGDRRRSAALAPPPRRPRRGVSAEGAGRGSRGSRLAAAPAPRARRAQPRAPARLRAAGHRRARGVAVISDVGRVAHAVRGAGAAVFSGTRARAARPRRAAADERHRPGVARGSARRPRGSPPDARGSPAAAPLRRGLRRQPAPGARPIVPGRLRARPRRADVSAEAARRSAAARRGDARAAGSRAADAGRSRQDRTPAAAARGRRGDRAAVALVPAPRRRRQPAARAVVLRARRHARDHRPHPEPRSAAAAGARRGRREARLAGAGAAVRRDRRSRARSRDAAGLARRAKPGERQGPRALPASLERRAAPLGDDALGAGAIALDASGRPGARHRGDQADARLAAARGAAVLAVGAAEVRDLPVPVPAVGDLPPRAERRAGAAAAARSADARRALPRGAGRVLPRAAGAGAAAGRRRRRCPPRCSSSIGR